MTALDLGVYPIVDLGSLGEDASEAERVLLAALRGGATIVQLREKREHMETLADVCRRVLPACREAGVPLIVDDRLDAALELRADGVHLGPRDTPVAVARELAASRGLDRFVVGRSVTTVEEADRAVADGASYLSASPVFGTATKPDIERPVGLAGVRALKAAHPAVPLVAIGGVRPAHVADLVAAGADGVCFISALGASPASAVAAMAAAVDAARRAS